MGDAHDGRGHGRALPELEDPYANCWHALSQELYYQNLPLRICLFTAQLHDWYKEIVDPDFSYKNFSPEEQLAILAADRSNNCLDTTRLSELCPEISSIKDAVKVSLRGIKENIADCPAPVKQVLDEAAGDKRKRAGE